MARIPLGNFGEGGGTAPLVRTRAPGGADPVGEALGELGRTGAQLAQTRMTVQEAEARREQEERGAVARAQAENALLDYEIEVGSAVGDVQSRVQSGDLNWQQADAEAKQLIGKIQRPSVQNLDPADTIRFQTGINRKQRRGMLEIEGTVRVARRQARKTEVIGVFDRLDKLAGLPSSDIDRLTSMMDGLAGAWQEAGLDPAEFERTRQTHVDRWWVQHASRREMMAREDPGALTALADDLAKDEGFYASRLDAAQRNTLLNRVIGNQQRLEARAAVDANKREAAAGRIIDQYEKQVATGISAPADVMLEWTRGVAGTSVEAEFQDIQRGEIEIQQVMGLPPQAQRGYLQALRAKQQTEGATVSDQLRADRLERAVESRLKLLREAPLEFYGTTTGKPVAPLDLGQLAGGDLSELKLQVQERLTLLRAQRGRFGFEAGMAPLLPQEASAMSGLIARAPPAAAVQLFGGVRELFDDPAAYQEAMKQIAPEAPLRAEAGRIYALQRPAGTPPGPITAASPNARYGDVALTILRGEALLNPAKGSGDAKPVTMPPPTEVQREIGQQLGAAFAGRPDELRNAFDAINAFYAAKTADAGDARGVLNRDRLQEAIGAVVGERVTFEDRDVIPPWGMSGATFRDRADLYIQARLKAAGREDPGNVALINVRGQPGYYALVRGFQPLYDTNNPPQPLIIRIRSDL